MFRKKSNRLRHKKRGIRLGFTIVFLNVLLWTTGLGMWYFDGEGNRFLAEFFRDEVDYLDSSSGYLAPDIANEPPLSILSENAILINITTGEVLFEQRADDLAHPASLTKMMTTLLGATRTPDEVVSVVANFQALHAANASMAGFSYGEFRTLNEVLHGAMLTSGADATATIANYIGGSYEGFVTLMNEKAHQIGLMNTTFTNASGLHHQNQVTTARDMANLVIYAIENETFLNVFTAENFTLSTQSKEGRTIFSTMFVTLGSPHVNGGTILGGKDGFTPEAGLCLASIATDGENKFVLVTMGGRSVGAHVNDARHIYGHFLGN